MKYLSKLKKKDIAGKIFVVRVSLNIKPSDVDGSFRFDRAMVSPTCILKNGGRVVLVSHRGRPKINQKSKIKNQKFEATGEELLKPFIRKIEKSLKTKVLYFDHFDFRKMREEIKQSDKKVFLIENIRLHPGEIKNSSLLAKELSSVGNIYVNDAFADSHRAHASIVGVTKHIPSYAGLVMEEEISHLNKTFSALHPFALILGGIKISDKIGIINKLGAHADFVLTGGGIANTLLEASGVNIKNSIAESAAPAKKYLKNKKIILPFDMVWDHGKILDIGRESSEYFSSIIKTARMIVWNGPLGLSEEKKFSKGTQAVWDAIKVSHADVIIGGGETTAFVLKDKYRKSKLPKNIFLSTGGGAMLEYLSGEKLPGIKVLR